MNGPEPAAEGRGWLRQPAFALVVTLFFLMAFCHRADLQRQPDPMLGMATDRGYAAAVRALVEKDCLTLTTVGDRNVVEFNEGKAGQECPSREAFESYHHQSFLASDMSGLVRQRWVMDEGDTDGSLELVGLRDNTHLLHFSADEDVRSGVTITYRDSTAGSPGLAPVNQNGIRDDTTPLSRECLVDGKKRAGRPREGQFVFCNDGFWQFAPQIGSISELSPYGERTREPTLADVARKLDTSAKIGNDIIQSSIRKNLHFAMQRQLDKHLRGASTVGKAESVIRAAILLMDGRTGEIAAAATFPGKPNAADTNNRWATNWNFQPLEIGSTAKIPFAAAITQANNGYLGKYSPNGDLGICREDVAEERCRKRTSDHPSTNYVDFIAISSNHHAAWLLREAKNGKAPGWEDAFRHFTCAEPNTEVDAVNFPDCSPYLWRSANEVDRGMAETVLSLRLGKAKEKAAANPKRTMLFDEYYMASLGGRRSRWTTVNLAQSYARIFTGTAVKPRLTVASAMNPNTGKIEKDSLPGKIRLDIKVWQSLKEGMKGVLLKEKRGTAARLCTDLKCTKGNSFRSRWLYAKTGTATIGEKHNDDAKTLVMLAVSSKTGVEPQSPDEIADIKVLVLTQRYYAKNKEAIDLALRLFNDSDFLAWLEQS